MSGNKIRELAIVRKHHHNHRYYASKLRALDVNVLAYEPGSLLAPQDPMFAIL